MQDGIEFHVSLAPKGLELIMKGDGGSKIVSFWRNFLITTTTF